MDNLFDVYNNKNRNISVNIEKLNQEINDLSDKEYLEKEKTVEMMYVETSKLERKEYLLFVGTSIITSIIIILTYKITTK